jgi:hypothetical protein
MLVGGKMTSEPEGRELSSTKDCKRPDHAGSDLRRLIVAGEG